MAVRPIASPRQDAPSGTASFQILSLSGGGYRGLFTAIILEELEQHVGRPLNSCFNLIAGTSIGGILACGLAAGISATTMRRAFESRGAEVFDKHIYIAGRRWAPLPRLGILGARYTRTGLEEVIKAVLGDATDMPMRELPQRLLVPAVSATNGRAVIYESGSSVLADTNVTLRQAALATSAAPTFFPEFGVEAESLVDGGLIANAPDMIAIARALTTSGRRPEDLRMLSIGTAGTAVGEVFKAGKASGGLAWLRRGIFNLTITAQQDLAVSLSAQMLRSRFVRIDIQPDQAKAAVTALDRADEQATSALKSLASQAFRLALEQRPTDLSTMLRHVA